MSIADKLTQLKRDIDEVYEAGYNNWPQQMTDWSYFFYAGHRGNMISQLKFDDTCNGTRFEHMFNAVDTSIKVIPSINTSKGTAFQNMYAGNNLVTSIGDIDTSNGIYFGDMFMNCRSINTIPDIDTSKGTSFIGMFRYCFKLRTIPRINVSKSTHCNNMFDRCDELKEITTIEGTIGVSINFTYSPLSVATTKKIINSLKNYKETDKAESYTIGFSDTVWANLNNAEAPPSEETWQDYVINLGWLI